MNRGYWGVWALVALVALGVGLRLWGLGEQPLWLDEASSWAYAARGSWWGTVWSEVIHPPLERLLLRGWLRVIPSDSEGWLRLLPALWGSLTVAAWAWLWTEIGRCERALRVRSEGAVSGDGRGAAGDDRDGAARERLWAVGAVAVSPFLVAYSQELRMYALLSLWVVLGWALTVRWVRTGSGWAGLGALGAGLLGMYTHYFAALTWAGVWVALWGGFGWRVGWERAQGPKRALGAAVLGVLVVGLLYSPWAWYVVTHYQSVTRSGAGMWGALGYVLMQHTLGPGVIVFDTVRWTQGAQGTHGVEWGVMAAAVGVAAALGVGAWRALRGDGARVRRWVLLGGWGAPMLLGFLVMQPLSGLLRPHYLIGASPLWLGLLAVGVTGWERGWRQRAAGAGLAALLGLGLVGYFGGGRGWEVAGWELRYGKERWRQAVEAVRQGASPGAVVLLTPGYLGMPFDYYDRGAHRWVGLDDEAADPDRDLTEALREAGEPDEVWLLISHRWYDDTYIDALTRAGWRGVAGIDYREQWGIRLRVFKRPSATGAQQR